MLGVRQAWTVRLLAVALLLGGLRDPRLFAVGGAAVWAAVWINRPPMGPARPWLPWLGWALLSTFFSASPLSGLPVLARWSAVLAYASLAAAWGEAEREEWVKTLLAAAAALGAAALATGAGRGWRNAMTGLIPPYYNYTVFVLAAATAAAAVWALHPRGAREQDADEACWGWRPPSWSGRGDAGAPGRRPRRPSAWRARWLWDWPCPVAARRSSKTRAPTERPGRRSGRPPS
ncbi:MAG: hypothetical protein A2V88_15055 [Elusimicrobia bacterium RBG_16_66_12]|nr:MAG: hypothetical protein A2V88_15055 [Elusimicrobia bacterium RBG_16_66_12]